MHRRRLIVVNGSLAHSWKLRTLTIDHDSIALARLAAADLREYSSEDQRVRQCNRTVYDWYNGHQTTRAPGGVGLL
ncbi:MAG: hypothetical protein AB7S57_19620 [Acetobacteraceae bacterium]